MTAFENNRNNIVAEEKAFNEATSFGVYLGDHISVLGGSNLLATHGETQFQQMCYDSFI